MSLLSTPGCGKYKTEGYQTVIELKFRRGYWISWEESTIKTALLSLQY